MGFLHPEYVSYCNIDKKVSKIKELLFIAGNSFT